jgi:pSer/pThr/pTyr-binding forkhead associated (FHA) protein
VNLENFNAVELGVSRRHALLTRRGLQLFLQDLNSTNASYLNGEKITPGHDYALRDGDEISLGRMKMRIFFK